MKRLPLLLALTVLACPVASSGNPTKRFVGDFRANYTAPAATNNVSLQFLVDGAGIPNGLRPEDISVSILRGSRFVSSLDPGSTLKLTRLQNGDLLVQIVGDIRSPTNATQSINFRIAIERPNVKTLRIRNPRWGDSDPAQNNDFSPLGPATLAGGMFVLDPLYVAFNDLPATPFTVQNLEFASNLSQLDLDALNVDDIFARSLDLLLPSFTLSPGTSSEDLNLLFNAGSEPEPDLYLVAMGQLVDPASGEKVGAFIHAIQGAPEPGTLAVLAAGIMTAASVVARRRRRARSAR